MSANRIWVIATVVVIGAVFVLGWILGISPLLAQAANADAERVAVEQTNAAEAARLEEMRQIALDVETLRGELRDLRVSIPGEVDTDLMYRLLAGIQDAAQAPAKSIVTSDAVVYGSQVGSAETVPQPAPAGAPGGQQTTTPAVAPAGLHAVPFTITFDAQPVDRIMAFVEGLQASPRLFLVTDVTADEISNSSITAYMFVMDDPASPRGAAGAQLTGVAPQGVRVKSGDPEPTATPAPGATETPAPEESDDATPAPTGSPTPTP